MLPETPGHVRETVGIAAVEFILVVEVERWADCIQ
jgi:hypothetical protein